MLHLSFAWNTNNRQRFAAICRYRKLILNWFETNGTISSGSVDGFKNQAKLTMRMAYGFRSPRVIEIAIFHTLGNLSEQISIHRFC
ncbi:MAG: transposase [Planctomycetes bacterium]|nr:transposase [Planctomycetota bacterium]